MKKACVLQTTGGKWQKNCGLWQTLEMLANRIFPYVSGFPAERRLAKKVKKIRLFKYLGNRWGN